MAVVFKADSDFSKVLKDYERMQSRVVQLEQKLRDVTKEAKNQEGGFKATFEGGVSQLKSMVSGYASLTGAITAVNQGLAEQKRINEEIRRVQLSAADAQANLLNVMDDSSPEKQKAFIESLTKLSQEAGMQSVVPTMAAAKDVLGAGASEDLTKLILQKTLPLLKSDPEAIAPFAGAVGDLADVTGAKSEADVERVVAMMLSSQGYSRGTTMASFQEMVKGILGGMAVDSNENRFESAREGLAFSTAIGRALGDPNAAESKTAWAEVATQLEMFMPEKDVVNSMGKTLRKGTGLKTGAERLAAIWGDKSGLLQKKFFEEDDGYLKPSFRGAIAPVIKDLIQDQDSPIAKAYRAGLEGIQADPGLYQRRIESLKGLTPQLSLAKADRTSKANIEMLQLQSDLGFSAQAKSIVDTTLEQTRTEPFGMGYVPDKFKMAALSIGAESGAAEGSIAALRQREFELKQRVPNFVATALGGTLGAMANQMLPKQESELSQDRKAQLQLIRDQIKILEEIRDAQQRTQAGAGAMAAASLQAQREGR